MSAMGGCAATKIIVLGQCHAGVFEGMPLQHAVICCACDAGGLSYPVPRDAPGVEPLYSEFLYQLVGALAGRYPDGAPILEQVETLPPPGQISIGEAFRYARDHDRWITGMLKVNELPRIFDSEGLADKLRL